MNELLSNQIAAGNSAIIYAFGAVCAAAVAGATCVLCKIVGSVRDFACRKSDVAIAEAEAKAPAEQNIYNNYGASITIDDETD